MFILEICGMTEVMRSWNAGLLPIHRVLHNPSKARAGCFGRSWNAPLRARPFRREDGELRVSASEAAASTSIHMNSQASSHSCAMAAFGNSWRNTLPNSLQSWYHEFLRLA